MNVNKILALATKYHENQYRNDGKTPYIKHPIRVCELLYDLGITKKKYTEDDLDGYDYIFYAIALMHDLLEDTNITKEEIIANSDDFIANSVELLTYKEKSDNPFSKFGYLHDIAMLAYIPGNEYVFLVKCCDRIANVSDFMYDNNRKYAKKYFHKADILWDTIYRKKEKYPKILEAVLKLNEEME